MSNFICSECGMTNIDCGRDGYKTPKEIELEKKVHILNEANMKLENEFGHFADLSKKVERLQEQVSEANEVIKECKRLIKRDGVLTSTEGAMNEILKDYLSKWGVK